VRITSLWYLPIFTSIYNEPTFDSLLSRKGWYFLTCTIFVPDTIESSPLHAAFLFASPIFTQILDVRLTSPKSIWSRLSLSRHRLSLPSPLSFWFRVRVSFGVVLNYWPSIGAAVGLPAHGAWFDSDRTYSEVCLSFLLVRSWGYCRWCDGLVMARERQKPCEDLLVPVREAQLSGEAWDQKKLGMAERRLKLHVGSL
jgi:hypothetical protein